MFKNMIFPHRKELFRMAFCWRHQVDNVFSPIFYSPSELLNYNDKYYEDYAYRVKQENSTEYVGLVQTVGIRRCHPNYRFLNRISGRYSLHYVFSGKAWAGDREVGEGDVFGTDFIGFLR